MSNFSQSILFSLLFLLTISCAEKKNNEQTTEKKIDRSEMQQNKDRSQTSRPIEEVIEIWVKSLGDRLKIDEQTIVSIQKIYTDAYISSGGSLEDFMDKDEAQLIRHQIVRDTKEEVVKLLNSDQQQIYLRFIKD